MNNEKYKAQKDDIHLVDSGNVDTIIDRQQEIHDEIQYKALRVFQIFILQVIVAGATVAAALSSFGITLFGNINASERAYAVADLLAVSDVGIERFFHTNLFISFITIFIALGSLSLAGIRIYQVMYTRSPQINIKTGSSLAVLPINQDSVEILYRTYVHQRLEIIEDNEGVLSKMEGEFRESIRYIAISFILISVSAFHMVSIYSANIPALLVIDGLLLIPPLLSLVWVQKRARVILNPDHNTRKELIQSIPHVIRNRSKNDLADSVILSFILLTVTAYYVYFLTILPIIIAVLQKIFSSIGVLLS